MNIFVHTKMKNWTGGYSEECYGPFASTKGAICAAEYIRRVDANTGQYHNRTKVIRRKGQPVERTLTWPEFCAPWKGRSTDIQFYHTL